MRSIYPKMFSLTIAECYRLNNESGFQSTPLLITQSIVFQLSIKNGLLYTRVCFRSDQ